MCWNTGECRSVSYGALVAIIKGRFMPHCIRLSTASVGWLLFIVFWASSHSIMAASCLVATRIKLIYVDATNFRLSFWKTFLPNQIARQDYRLSRSLGISFSVAVWDALQVRPVPFNISDPDLKWKGCMTRPGYVCRRKCSGSKEAACFVGNWKSVVTGRKGWQLHHMLCAFWQTHVLRWTFRSCFRSSCWGEHKPFEQNFGLFISCFLRWFKACFVLVFFFFKKKKEQAVGSHQWSVLALLPDSALHSWEKYLSSKPHRAGNIREVKVT